MLHSFLRLVVAAFVLVVALPANAAQGVAVLGTSGARDDAFALARAVYVTSLRPRSLDEVRARVLAGDPAPGVATKEVKDLADLRAAVNGEDVASRQILSGIAKQLGVQALLVVTKSTTGATTHAPPVDADAGDSDAGPGTWVQARLFVSEQSEFDAARYDFDGSWQATVASVSARFPQTSPPPAPTSIVAAPSLLKVPTEKKEDRPFYKSPWLWGAVAAAVLIGGIFFFASQDKSDDPIHVRMNVPR